MSTEAFDPPWVYQQGVCDVWQIAHLCNYMAEYGWEFLSMVESYDGQLVSETVRDDDGPLHKALKGIVVLFRRPTGWGGEE